MFALVFRQCRADTFSCRVVCGDGGADVGQIFSIQTLTDHQLLHSNIDRLFCETDRRIPHKNLHFSLLFSVCSEQNQNDDKMCPLSSSLIQIFE